MTKGFCNSIILYNKEVSDGSFRMGISWKAQAVRPGQFVMLKASRGHDPLLRRPFGIYNVIGAKPGSALKGRGIEVLYRVVGRGTEILSTRKPGESVDVLGPLGNGFPSISGKSKIIIVAGGMGIAPLNLLAKTLNPPYPPLDKGGIGGVFLFGARDKAQSALAKGLKGIKCKVKLSTEDGSAGKKGLVTGLLMEEVSTDSVIYACGPAGMLKAVAKIALEAEVECHVSLERAMACGMGACLGCAVKSAGGHLIPPLLKGGLRGVEENKTYKMVCSDGPVFNSLDIDWDRFDER